MDRVLEMTDRRRVPAGGAGMPAGSDPAFAGSGAGTQALQLFRSCIRLADPSQLPAFAELQSIDVILNAQKDWKTWDTNPIWAIAMALGMSPPTDLFGERLSANAANPTLADMHHRQGFVLARIKAYHNLFTAETRAFREAHPDQDLLEKNY